MNELDLFTEALSRSDPVERAAFLDQTYAGYPELRRRLEELLASHARGGSPLDRPPVALGGFGATVEQPTRFSAGESSSEGATEAFDLTDPDATSALESDGGAPLTIAPTEYGPIGTAATSAQPDPDATTAMERMPRAARIVLDERIGTTVAGRYTLVEEIGEGGMGTVYLASQIEPVRRHVALKLIKTGMDSRGVLARFDAERQALALMDHPNIAQIYDGGVTPANQPFFVMELVRGVPLTEYCDSKRLSVRARLELFVTVCQAVQHAHQKGIIHRDLKPGNVLVTEVDGKPTPKVIDFGVAKATELKLTDMSFADTGAIVGTPAYMSPEQGDPTSMDIDTRTDVYALGVILYELLVGSPPLDARDLRRGAILEILRMVREVDPPRPSTKLSSADALPNIAANRSIEPARLSKLLRGELDWVVMKALEKDRDRRYETANGFARDIQRYLADEVVEARPPTQGYRLKKFVKRNKIQVIAAGLVFVTFAGGIVGTSLGLASARKAQQAEARQRIKADNERDKAIASERQTAIERDKAIAAEAKTQTINNFLTRDLLTQAEPANNAVEDKVTLLEILDRAAKKVGTRFANKPELERSLRQTIAKTYHGLASWKKAKAQSRAVLDTARKRDPRSAEAYQAQGDLAHILRHRGRPANQVLEMAEAAGDGLVRTLGADDPSTLTTRNHLALAYQAAGRLPEAITLFERVSGAQVATLGPDHPETLATLDNLALAYQHAGKFPQAIALGERVRDAEIAKIGPDHPDTLITLHNLAMAYQAIGRLTEAIALFEHVRDAQIAQIGPDSPGTLTTLNNLAAVYWRAGLLNKSIPLFEDVLKRQEALLGRLHPDTLSTVANLGVNYKDAGRIKEAIPLLEEVHQATKQFPVFRWVVSPLIEAYIKAGEDAKLAELIKEQLSEARSTLPKDSPQLSGLLTQIGSALLQQKQWTEAEPLLRESLAIREKSQPNLWSTFNTQSLLGGVLLGQKKYADAEPLLRKGYEGLKQREQTIPQPAKIRLPEAFDRLIDLSTATNKPDEVKKWQAERAKYPEVVPPSGQKK
jgi:eukaryotic-like serine/threonine-protein kinase